MSVKEIKISDTKLSLTEQLELGRRTAAGDKAAREKLVLSCVPLVKSFLKTSLCQCFSSHDDAFQDGMTGVLEAVDKYDHTKNVMFSTYAYFYIHKNILKGVISRTPIKISDEDFFNATLLNSTIDSFYAAYRVFPTNEQLSKLTAIPLNKIEFLRKRDINKITISLDDTTEVHAAQVFPEADVSVVVEKALKTSLQKKFIGEAFKTLTTEEKEIIQKRFLYEEQKVTLRELAISQKVSIEAVSKREKSALKKLFAFFVGHDINFEDLI